MAVAHKEAAFVARDFVHKGMEAALAGIDSLHRAYQEDEAAVVADFHPSEVAHGTEDAAAEDFECHTDFENHWNGQTCQNDHATSLDDYWSHPVHDDTVAHYHALFGNDHPFDSTTDVAVETIDGLPRSIRKANISTTVRTTRQI